jgi:hypothetical protein
MQLEISNKKIGIRLNNFAIEQLPKVKGREQSYYTAVAALVWCGYLGWCVWKQIDPELEFGEVSDWVDSSVNDEAVAEQIREIYKLYEDTEAYKRLQKKSELNGQLLPEEQEK